MSEQKSILIATQDGVYLGRHDEGESGDARLAGLAGKGTVRSVIADHRRAGRYFATASEAGIWRSDDGGEHWHEINQGIYHRQGFCLAQHPSTGELYYGCEPAAVFKSVDDGDNWSLCRGLQTLRERIDWTFPGPPYVPHVKHLALYENDPAIVYGAVEEGWLIRSTDGGETWQNLKQGTEFDAHTVTVMPGDPAVILQTSGKGAYRSEDGGDTFCDANAGIDHRYLAHLVVHPDRSNTLYTAGAAVPPPHWRRPEGPGAGFYRSDDQGRSWQRLTGGLPPELEAAAPRATAGDPNDPDVFYAGLTDGRVWATQDGGDSFAMAFEGLPPILAICVPPS